MKVSAILFAYSLFITLFLNCELLKSDFYIFYNSLVINSFILHIKILATLVLIIISLISIKYFKFEKIYTYEFFILLNIITLGLFTLIEANDLLVMYMSIEIISLSFYILTAIKIHSNFSTEAGMKYFILGAFASGLLLYGSSLIYGSVGSINFYEIAMLTDNSYYAYFTHKVLEWEFFEDYTVYQFLTYFSHNYTSINFDPFIIGVIFIVIGLLFKLGAAPFHMWLPDVYEGAPTIVTLIFSIVPKMVIFGLLININIHFFFLDGYFFYDMFFYVSILSIIIGSLGALYQTKIKRLLAYSAISHVGFLFIGLLTFTEFSLASLYFYLFVYILISINLFVILLVLRKYNTNLKIKKINEYVLIYKSHPVLAINFAILLFSIAGIPPLAGFYSKFYIFLAAMESQLYLLVIVAAIFSVISSMYYIRIIKLMFFKKYEYWNLFYNIGLLESILCSLILFFNIFFFCYPEIIMIYITNVVNSI